MPRPGIGSRWSAVVAFAIGTTVLLGACSRAAGPPPTPVAPTPDTLLYDGRVLYTSNCARCHGGDLKGGPFGPPLLDAAYRPSEHPDATFARAVRDGVQPHHWNFGPMPPVDGLTDEQVKLITAFVRSEQQKVGIR